MADETHDLDPLARLAPHVRAVERRRPLLCRGCPMSDQTVALLIEALVDEAGRARELMLDVRRLSALVEQYRAPVVDAEPVAPTIARVYLVKMATRLRLASQLLRRGRNAELSRDLADSAEVVEKFLRDTRGKK